MGLRVQGAVEAAAAKVDALLDSSASLSCTDLNTRVLTELRSCSFSADDGPLTAESYNKQQIITWNSLIDNIVISTERFSSDEAPVVQTEGTWRLEGPTVCTPQPSRSAPVHSCAREIDCVEDLLLLQPPATAQAGHEGAEGCENPGG